MGQCGLIKGIPKDLVIPDEPCFICLQSKAQMVPRGHPVLTIHLTPGMVLHMDFAFVKQLSICYNVGFLTVTDACTCMLWVFATRNKHPLLLICQYILHFLSNQNQRPLEI